MMRTKKFIDELGSKFSFAWSRILCKKEKPNVELRVLAIGLGGSIEQNAHKLTLSFARKYMLPTILIAAYAHSIAQSNPRLMVNDGHGAAITAIAISNSAGITATADSDGVVFIRETKSLKQLQRLPRNPGYVSSIDFNHDGTLLALASQDGVQIFQPNSGELLLEHTSIKTPKSVQFDQTRSSLLVTTVEHGLVILDVSRNKVETNYPPKLFSEPIQAAQASPDSSSIAIGGREFLLVIDAKTGGAIWKVPHSGLGVNSISYSSLGDRIASAHEDGKIRVWSAVSGKMLNEFAHSNEQAATKVIFSSDDKQIISAGRNESVLFWNTNTNGGTYKFRRSGRRTIRTIAWDKVRSAVIYGDDSGDLKASTERDNLVAYAPNIGGRIYSAATSSTGNLLAYGDEAGTIHIINYINGRILQNIYSMLGSVQSVALSDDGTYVASAHRGGGAVVWDVISGKMLSRIDGHKRITEHELLFPENRTDRDVYSIAFSADNDYILTAGGDHTVQEWDWRNRKMKYRFMGHSGGVLVAAYSPKGDQIASGGFDGRLVVRNRSTGDKVLERRSENEWILALAFSRDGKTIISSDSAGLLRAIDTSTGKEVWSVRQGSATFSLRLRTDGRALVTGSEDKVLRERDLLTGKLLRELDGHESGIRSVGYINENNLIYSAGLDKTLRFWSARTGVQLATVLDFGDFDHQEIALVLTPEGRFDTADLESMPHLHWVMPDDPFTPVPLEAFMKDYYEPRLLARILAGETFKPVRALTSLNRTQPEVKIVSVVPEGSDPSLVRVTVSAAGATKSYLQGEGASAKEVARPTAVHDLRLFRDGQVVGYADGKLAEFSASASGSAFTKTFTVRLPRAKAGQDVVFSAYAFNDDRVKSETVRATYKAPAVSSAVAATSNSAKGRAYVISMGVNQHENSAWNLGYAANDARAVAQRVSGDLRKSAQYAEVVPLVLAADGSTQQASKAALRAVLARLAGQVASPADQAALQGVAGAEQLRKAQPDDLVLISFAGHGFADDAGQFYLVPQDTGSGSGKQITAALKTKSISSEELSLWLRDVDAGDMTMIVDACQSAASVQAEGFKPGPMGSRGLGQLSFDKGMRILAASQSDEFALEDQRLKHGLLTFSLINDGLEAFNADFEPQDKKIWLDEWLKYGVKRVPTLADEIKSGTVKVANRGPERGAVRVDVPAASGKPSAKARPAQQPALFDFAKKRRPLQLSARGD